MLDLVNFQPSVHQTDGYYCAAEICQVSYGKTNLSVGNIQDISNLKNKRNAHLEDSQQIQCTLGC